MRYISTRGQAPDASFTDALMAGMASDGGLYVPETWPRITAPDLDRWAALPYADLAYDVMAPYASDVPEDVLRRVLGEAYATFDHAAVAPLTQIDRDLWLLELFHGPTLAFKDLAMQVLSRLFDWALNQRGESVTIVGATSGDTGAAAIQACRDRPTMRVFILYPHGRISEVQRRQMTTTGARNIFPIAIDGTFDDCQALLKAMFADPAFRDEMRLSAVNSINWARILPQVVYYVASAIRLGRPASFAVPTGNFGDIYAGYIARRMGVPIERLVLATNANDILHRFLKTGVYEIDQVTPTQSPSMDIQVASNFERFLFDLGGRDDAWLRGRMGELTQARRFEVAPELANTARRWFDSAAVDEATTTAKIADMRRRTGRLLDPHTCVGLAAAEAAANPPTPMVALATAHAAKFPDAVEAATGERPSLPASMAGMMDRPEQVERLANDLGTVQAYMRGLTAGH
ncbi:MAG: threonine synthase [Alphaproteobacteria bacterium]